MSSWLAEEASPQPAGCKEATGETSEETSEETLGEVSREATGEAETLFIGGKIVGKYHMAVLTGVEACGDVNPHGSAAIVLEEQLVNIAM